MGFINKEKVLRGVGKAVDVTNNAADKVRSLQHSSPCLA